MVGLRRQTLSVAGALLMATVAMAVLASPLARAQNRLQVVTTLPDLASIASEVGGAEVETFAIASGFQNPHFVDPKPSYILRLTRADMFVTIGLDLESGWVSALLNSARNTSVQVGGAGYVDASQNVPLLEIPSNVSRDQGDIHIYGNPHYWLDPGRMKIIAQNIFNGLVRLRPASRRLFEGNLERFNTRMDEKMIEWNAMMSPFARIQIVAYHNQWPYLEEAFGFDIVEFLEPKPGIPPTPSQLAKVIERMQHDNLKVLIIAPYYKRDAADLVVSMVGGRVVPLASSVGAFPGIDTVFDLFDYNVRLLADAFRSTTP